MGKIIVDDLHCHYGKPVREVLAAYRSKMQSREQKVVNGVRVLTSNRPSEFSLRFSLARNTPEWYVKLGGKERVCYDEILTIDPAQERVVTQSDQSLKILNWNVTLQIKVEYSPSSTGTTARGRVEIENVPAVVMALRAIVHKYIKRAFEIERTFEKQFLK